MAKYILKNESGIVRATSSLDEVTIWQMTGGTYQEVLDYDSQHLDIVRVNDEIEIRTDEAIATVEPEFYTEEGVVFVGRIIVKAGESSELLEKTNFTEFLKKDIEIEVERMREFMQGNLDSDLAEQDIDNYYFN